MSEKKIEPTDAMVDAVESARELMALDARTIMRAALNHPDAPGLFECDYTDYVHVDEAATRVEAAREQGWDDAAQHIYNKGWEGVTALRKANPHRPALSLPTDAFATNPPADADRPWEPLNEDDSLNVGDEVRRDYFGTTTTAVVGRVDDDGAPWTAEGCCLGLPGVGTWYIRRTVQELPAADGAVIVPAEGREFIEAVVNGHTYYAREAMLINGLWRAVWRTPHCFQVSYSVLPWKITPGTWKVDGEDSA